jgi:L-aspartate oxidase
MPLLTEALRGAGARLLDATGHRFMVDAHPDAELAPRHVVTAGIFRAGETFLDATSIGADRLEAEFPTVLSSCREHGFDITKEPVPVTPAAHYTIGGAAIGLDGNTTVPGLFAAGECAATGMHGANRLAGNSLAESVVFARRAGLAMAACRRSAGADPEWDSPPGGPVDDQLRTKITEAVTEGAGPIRDAASAARALARLGDLATEDAGRSAEAAAMVASGRLLVRGALAREETRGVHVRSDFPEPRNSYEGVRLAL